MASSKDIVGEIKRATSKRQLRPTSIVADLLLQKGLTQQEREDLLASQARVAQDKKDRRWLRRVSQDALEFGLSTREWIDSHIAVLPQQRRQESLMAKEPCRDIRLQQDNPQIQLIVSDAADVTKTTEVRSTSPDKSEEMSLSGFGAVLECSVTTIDEDHLLDMSTDTPTPAPVCRESTPVPVKEPSPPKTTEKSLEEQSSRPAGYSPPRNSRHGHRRSTPVRRDRSARSPPTHRREPELRSRRGRDQEQSRRRQDRHGHRSSYRSRSSPRREERVTRRARRSPVRQRVCPAVREVQDTRSRVLERTVTVTAQNISVERRLIPVRRGEASHEVVPAVREWASIPIPVSVESSGPSKKNQRRKRLRSRHQVCNIPGCSRPHRYPKLHVLKEHLPMIFDEFQPTSEFITRQRRTALKLISGWILGSEHVLAQLAAYIDGTDLLKEQHNGEVTQQTISAVTELCREGSMEVPETFTLRPLSSPMMLFHWRPMSILVARLEPRFRRSLLDVFSTAFYPQTVEARCTEPTAELEEEDVEEEEEDYVLAFDSHFRLRKGQPDRHL